MRGLSNLAALVAMASMSLAAETLLIQWATALATGEEMISASFNGSVVSTTCGNKLIVGSTEFEVHADGEARGMITVTAPDQSSQTYDLANDEICGGFWNQKFAEARCEIPLQPEFDENAAVSLTMENFDSCFSLEDVQLPFYPDEDSTMEEEDEAVDTSPDPASPSSTGLAERQLICSWVPTVRVRNPKNPQMYRRHVQLTPTVYCSRGTCSTSRSQTYSTTHSANIGKSTAWINGGFSVSRSKSYTFQLTCNGKEGEYMCIRHMARYQAYDTDDGLVWSCTGQSTWSKGSQQRSPLSNDADAIFYCGRGKNECRDNGWVAMHHVGPGVHRGA